MSDQDEMLIEESVDEYVEEFESARDSQSPQVFVKLLENIRTDDVALRIKEQCIYSLAKIHAENKSFAEVMDLLKSNNSFFGSIPKARTAKIVRSVLDIVSSVPDSIELQIALCRDIIGWCVSEKRTFLRQRVEGKLVNLLLLNKETHDALHMVNALLRELKKLDDKQMLTETHLTEARIYHAMQNIPKSKAALTAARSAATSIYVVPLLQAELDEMSGILHCEEGDTVTAYSYFLEAFEAYDGGKDDRALTVLKYMALCKTLNITADTAGSKLTGAAAVAAASGHSSAAAAHEVAHLFTGKYGLKYGGVDMEAMQAVAKAAEHRSLQEFKDAVLKYEKYLKTNHLISHNLDELYENMFESNLLKIVQPYSNVELSHVSAMIKLPLDQVERKLSQMVLDKKLHGILEQGKGHLVIYDSADADANYSRALEIIHNMGDAVEGLAQRTKRINTTKVLGDIPSETPSADKKSEEMKDKK